MENTLDEKIIKQNNLRSHTIQGTTYWECPDGYPAYSKEFAEHGYNECVKNYPEQTYGWFLAERNGVYWTANGCNKNHGIAAGWKIIKESKAN